MRPSRAAILFAGMPPVDLSSLLTGVLSSRRYTLTTETIPRGYPAYLGEWLGFVLTQSPNGTMSIIVPEDVSHVFTTALWIAESLPDQHFCAWQQLQGLKPVLKYYAKGRPQLRDGIDRDLEITWTLPQALPSDIRPPSEINLPSRATDVERLVGAPIETYRSLVQTPGTGDLKIGFLDRKSPLA